MYCNCKNASIILWLNMYAWPVEEAHCCNKLARKHWGKQPPNLSGLVKLQYLVPDKYYIRCVPYIPHQLWWLYAAYPSMHPVHPSTLLFIHPCVLLFCLLVISFICSFIYWCLIFFIHPCLSIPLPSTHSIQCSLSCSHDCEGVIYWWALW